MAVAGSMMSPHQPSIATTNCSTPTARCTGRAFPALGEPGARSPHAPLQPPADTWRRVYENPALWGIVRTAILVKRARMAHMVEARLQALGLALPPPPQVPPGFKFSFAWTRVRGNRVYCAGHGPQAPDGSF